MLSVSTLSSLALHISVENLLVPPSAYLTDRRKSREIHVPYISGRRAFGLKDPLPTSSDGSPRLPRVLREATSFVVMDPLVKTPGIFRISARAQTVEILRESYDRGHKFIVWREAATVLAYSHHKEGAGDVSIDEIDQTEGYELHAAAALIKLWYNELHTPIFPPTSYATLEKLYSHPDTSLEPSQLLDILSSTTGWSPLTSVSKKILTMHLLPLLSRIASFSDWNQMTPYNLSVCFAVSLLRGPDPLEDVKISSIIRRLLIAMITHWNVLAPALHTSYADFENSLRLPEAVVDREDPMEEGESPVGGGEVEAQMNGITLLDNDSSDTEEEELAPLPGVPPRPEASIPNELSLPVLPPLPPRPSDSVSTVEEISRDGNGISPVRRKPAPTLQPLPRYSMIVNDRPAALAGIPFYNTTEADGEEGHIERLPVYEQSISSSFHEAVMNAADGEITGTMNGMNEDRIATVNGVDDGRRASIARKPVGEGKAEG